MPRVSSHQIIRAGSISAFKKYVVAGVTRNLKASRRNNPMGALPDELQQLLPKAFANLELPTRQHVPVFREYFR